jgi:hypothetical protein
MMNVSPERDSNLRQGGPSLFATTPRNVRFTDWTQSLTFVRNTAAVVFAFFLVATASAAAGTRSVIELFTSQGCSSCPPADALLAEYAGREDILALSFNVDYWDMLGWKDTLASHDNTERQRNYSLARGDGQVYTPQMVIDGRTHVVGSNRDAIDAALQDSENSLTVPISLSLAGDSLSVKIGKATATDLPHATLWLVMYDSAVTVPIERGENSGKTITYSNVVRKLRPIAMWKGEPMSVDLPKSEIEHAKVGSCAVLLQAESEGGLPGPILGAATIKAGW